MNVPWRDQDLDPQRFTFDTTPNTPTFTLFVEVTEDFFCLRELLSEYDCITLPPENYYHLTLKRIGDFQAAQEIQQPLQYIAETTPTFSVNPASVDAFPVCIYVPIKQYAELKALHSRICTELDSPQQLFEGNNYRPHITVGYFNSNTIPQELVTELADYRDKEWSPVSISQIHLVRDTISEDSVYPNFESVATFSLSEKTI